MKKLKIISRFVSILVIIQTGCTQSMVYSPSLDIAHKPLEKGEMDLQMGVSLLPETRPHRIKYESTTPGANALFSFGITNKIALSMKSWYDIQNYEQTLRGGYSLSGQIIKPINNSNRFIFIPRIGITIGGLGVGKGGVLHSISARV